MEGGLVLYTDENNNAYACGIHKPNRDHTLAMAFCLTSRIQTGQDDYNYTLSQFLLKRIGTLAPQMSNLNKYQQLWLTKEKTNTKKPGRFVYNKNPSNFCFKTMEELLATGPWEIFVPTNVFTISPQLTTRRINPSDNSDEDIEDIENWF